MVRVPLPIVIVTKWCAFFLSVGSLHIKKMVQPCQTYICGEINEYMDFLYSLCIVEQRLLVDPAQLVKFPVDKFFLLEPKVDLTFCAFDGITTMTDVSAHIDGKITSDSTWRAV